MNTNLPFVTVIMPVRNEASFLGRSLEAVLCQDYPKEKLEILVVDGMSTDGTRELLHSLQLEHANLRLLDNPKKIVPTGMNIAIAHANGDVVVRVDGHCEIAPDYVRRCVEYLVGSDIGGVGGPLETIGTTRVAGGIAAAMSSPFGVGGSAFRTVSDKTMLADTVAFPAYKRSVLDQAGPYDEELVRNQDDEYNYRLRKMGVKILLAADIHARYYSRSSLRSLWRQYYRYGYWKVRVLQKHPRQMQWRQFIPPVFAISLLLSLVASLLSPIGIWALAFIGGGYLLANLAATALVSTRTSRWYFLYLPVTFATLHLSYGFGFLVGLLKFYDRWGEGAQLRYLSQ